jgi:sodium bicarbonate cotransporter 4
VEEGGTRWSKPHITMLSIPALLQLRNCLKKGTLMLDVEASSWDEIVKQMLDG